jgi:hypothetical protein
MATPFSLWRSVEVAAGAPLRFSLRDGPPAVLARALAQLSPAVWGRVLSPHLAALGILPLSGHLEGHGGERSGGSLRELLLLGTGGGQEQGEQGGSVDGGYALGDAHLRGIDPDLVAAVADEVLSLVAGAHYDDLGFLGAALWPNTKR